LGSDKKLIFDLHVYHKEMNPKGNNVFLLILIGEEYIKGPFLIKNFISIINCFNPIELRNYSIDRNIFVDNPVSNADYALI
jgi:hypothetical protein